MLQDMDHIEASCVFYVKVGRFDQLEQSKIWVLTVTSLVQVMLTVYHDLMVSVGFVSEPGNVLRQTSPDVCFISIKHEISATFHHDASLQTNTQHRADLLSIAALFEYSAAIHRRIHLEYNLQVGRHSFQFDLLLTLYSSGYPTSFHYHLPHLATTANHGSTNTSARCDWMRIEPKDRSFIQCAIS